MGGGVGGKAAATHLLRSNILPAYAVDMDWEHCEICIPELANTQIEVKSPYDLLYEDISSAGIFVIVAVNHRYAAEVGEFLASLGLRKGRDWAHWSELTNDRVEKYFDPFLGYGRIKGGIPQLFEVYGNAEAEYKIIALGGSTTDPYTFFQKSWPEYLYELFESDKVCVFNGGMGGYNSSQELLKLIRDVIPLKPDMVISWSGFNDAFWGNCNGHPMICEYLQETTKQLIKGTDMAAGFGIENNIEPESQFVMNERLMKGACDCLHITFIGFLQEALFDSALGKDYRPSVYEKDILLTNSRQDIVNRFYEAVDATSPFSDWFIDGRNFMGEATGLFIDSCHCYEEGNRLIASRIYEIIKKYLPTEVER